MFKVLIKNTKTGEAWLGSANTADLIHAITTVAQHTAKIAPSGAARIRRDPQNWEAHLAALDLVAFVSLDLTAVAL